MKNNAVTRSFKRYQATDDKYRIKLLWLYPILVIMICILSSLFIDPFIIRIVLSLILSIFPWLAITDKLYTSRYTHMRTQLLVLLQTLCTSVSSGYSIERSLVTTRPVLEQTFGKKSAIIKPLIELEQNINMHRDLKESLDTFAKRLYFPEIIPVFRALGISCRIGNNSLEILRSSCQMLSEMSAVKDEIDAQNSGKNAEAMILCFMPFAITFALNKMGSDYVADAKSRPLGALLMGIAFVLCIIAAALLFKYMTHKDTPRKVRSADDKNSKDNKFYLTKCAQRLFPENFISARYELFSELSTEPTVEYERYLKRQLVACSITAVLFTVILSILGKPVFIGILAIPVTCYLTYLDIKKDRNLRKEELMRDIPLFICLMSTLLESGMLLPRAIEICSEAFPNNKSLSYEIKNLRAMILSGISASDAVEKLSLRIKVPEAQAALLLVSRYGRLGSQEVLNLLSLQASTCWNLTRNAARKKQERESLGMILPMTLDFICVLLVATTPALISLGI
ncbi:MAG: type II secretion system F family protein [Clostridiales bacterium]|nr:type II secretion system F family protein [Clostridiales bacterium]